MEIFNVVKVKRNRTWFTQTLPYRAQFWAIVQAYKQAQHVGDARTMLALENLYRTRKLKELPPAPLHKAVGEEGLGRVATQSAGAGQVEELLDSSAGIANQATGSKDIKAC